VRTVEDAGVVRRLTQVERRIARLNTSMMASASLLAGALLYSTDHTFLGLGFWGVAALLWGVSLLRE
jgi:hypothetical protein